MFTADEFATFLQSLPAEQRTLPIVFAPGEDLTYAVTSAVHVCLACYCDEHGSLIPEYMFTDPADPDDPEDKPLDRAEYILLDRPHLYIELNEPTTVPTEG